MHNITVGNSTRTIHPHFTLIRWHTISFLKVETKFHRLCIWSNVHVRSQSDVSPCTIKNLICHHGRHPKSWADKNVMSPIHRKFYSGFLLVSLLLLVLPTLSVGVDVVIIDLIIKIEPRIVAKRDTAMTGISSFEYPAATPPMTRGS